MSTVTLMDIAAACGAEFGVTLDEMRRNWRNSGHREVPAVTARNAGMWLARRCTDHASAEIYAFFGLSHVNYAGECIRKIHERRQLDADFAERVDRITAALGLVRQPMRREAA